MSSNYQSQSLEMLEQAAHSSQILKGLIASVGNECSSGLYLITSIGQHGTIIIFVGVQITRFHI